MKSHQDTRRHSHLILSFCLTVSLIFCAGTAVADTVDCSEQLQQIPRDGSTVEVRDIWLSYSGNTFYGGVADQNDENIEVVGPDGGAISFTQRDLAAMSHAGVAVDGLTAGEYSWKVGDGPQATFTVADAVEADAEPPRMGEGTAEAELELMVYEDFPVIFREWEISFPAATDNATSAENMRYLVEFSWSDDHEGDESTTILVTPEIDQAGNDTITVVFGGRVEECRHGEPGVALTSKMELEVRAVDLTGNISEEPATGSFEGVSEEKLAAAHDEFHVVIDGLETDEDAPTTEEVARAMEAEEEPEEQGEGSSGCATTRSSSHSGLLLFVVALVVGYAGRKRIS